MGVVDWYSCNEWLENHRRMGNEGVGPLEEGGMILMCCKSQCNIESSEQIKFQISRTRTVELVLVVDHAEYKKYGSRRLWQRGWLVVVNHVDKVVRRVLQEEEIRGELWSERSTPPDEPSPLSAPSVSRDPAGDPGSTRASEGSSGPPTASTWGGCCPVVVLHLSGGLGPSSGSSLLLCPHTSTPHTEHTSSL
ncbi:unnamed protein product [Boreogadus saida]